MPNTVNNLEVNITDLDGTLFKDSFKSYEKFFGIKIDEGNMEKVTRKVLKLIKGEKVSDVVSGLRGCLEYNEELLKHLIDKKKKGTNIIAITDNFGAIYLVPKGLDFNRVYSPTVLETEGGKFTGGILNKYPSKVEIVKKILGDYAPIPEIHFHTNGGESDERVIEYLQNTCEGKVEIHRY